jgi:hypothetical protein
MDCDQEAENCRQSSAEVRNGYSLPRLSPELVNGISEVLFHEQIQQRVAELGQAIPADYAGKSPLLVGVLRSISIYG